jgi:hypothetical protein
MGADKNSSRRMKSAYAPNLQPRIPTRVCQGHLVTTDLPTLGTNPNSKEHESATQEAKDLDNLRCLGRTDCMDQANCLPGPSGLSAGSLRTVRNNLQNLQYCTLKNALFVLYPRTDRVGWTVCTHLANCPPNFVQPKAHGRTDRTKDKQEHTKNSMNYYLTASSRTVCQGRADRPRGAQIAARARSLEGQHLLPFARSPESTKGLLPNHRCR